MSNTTSKRLAVILNRFTSYTRRIAFARGFQVRMGSYYEEKAFENNYGYSVTRTTLSPWNVTKIVLAGGFP